MSTSRQPKGLPAGGQFAPETHAEPGVSLPVEHTGSAPATGLSQEEIRTWAAGQASHHISPVIGWLRRDAKGVDTTARLTSFAERVGRLADDIAERFSVTPQGLKERADATGLAGEAIRNHLQPLFAEVADGSGKNSTLTDIRWRTAADATANEIARKVTAPAPVLDGFTAAEVEDYLAREQHSRQCGCDLKDDVCATKSYGEHWRYRLGVPDVEGIFDSIKEMHAAEAAKKAPEGNG